MTVTQTQASLQPSVGQPALWPPPTRDRAHPVEAAAAPAEALPLRSEAEAPQLTGWPRIFPGL